MEWVLVVGRYHAMLLTVIADLFARAHIAPGERPEADGVARYNRNMTTLPRYVVNAVMLLLEPAEAALRRLLVIVAHGKGWTFKVRQAGNSGAAGAKLSAIMTGDKSLRGPSVSHGGFPKGSVAAGPDVRKPRKHKLKDDLDIPGFIKRDWDAPPPWSKILARSPNLGLANIHVLPPKPPRFPAFNMFDPLPNWKNTVFVRYADEDKPVPARPFPDHIPQGFMSTPVSAIMLWRRINSLHIAAQNLEKTARRYARWKARRDYAAANKLPVRPNRACLLKPGHPPGWSKKWRHDVDQVLHETHFFAHDALYPTGERRIKIDWDAMQFR